MSEISFKTHQPELMYWLSGGEGEHDGPIDAFKTDEHVKKIALEHAVEHGNLVGVNFADCPPFDDLEQKSIRREALRAARISEILSQKEESELDLRDRVIIKHTEKAIWENTLVEAARRAHLAETGQGKDDPEFCADMMRQAMEFLYEPPSRELALDTCGLMLKKLEELRETADPEVIGEVDRFLAKYPFMIEGRSRLPEVLSKQREAEIKAYFEALCGNVFRQLHHEYPDVNNDLVTEVARRYMELRGFTAKGWKVVQVGPPRVGFATSPESKTLEHGTRTIPATWPVIEGLLVHEIERHVASAQAGYELDFPPLVVGLPGSEDAEEGIAKTYQKAWQGTASKKTVFGVDHYRYLVGSYGYGTLDGEYHNPDETFQFMSELKYLLSMRGKEPAEINRQDLQKKARKEVFEHVYRAYRGMPEGLVFIKDLAYLSGSVKLAKFMNDNKRPTNELINYLNRGKFDPTNEEHVEIIRQIFGEK